MGLQIIRPSARPITPPGCRALPFHKEENCVIQALNVYIQSVAGRPRIPISDRMHRSESLDGTSNKLVSQPLCSFFLLQDAENR